jgi:hypothetical protein
MSGIISRASNPSAIEALLAELREELITADVFSWEHDLPVIRRGSENVEDVEHKKGIVRWTFYVAFEN